MQKGRKAFNMFFELKDLCYRDDLDAFDKLHDDLFDQTQGIYESIMEAIDDDEDGDGFQMEFQEALELANDIKDYREELIANPLDESLFSREFIWIYG